LRDAIRNELRIQSAAYGVLRLLELGVRTASRMYSYISKQKPYQDKLCHYIRIGYLTLALQCTALKSWAWSAWPRPRGFQWRFAVSVITFARRLRCTSHYQDAPGIMSHTTEVRTIVLREEESVDRTTTSLCEAHIAWFNLHICPSPISPFGTA
jgi:hypothetical protein